MIMHRPQRQNGFTLIELSIAMLIGLFLIGGLLVMLQGNRRAYTGQTQLAQLQDNQRLAMTLITDVVQSAGYFPNPVTNTAVGMLPALAPFAAGQSVWGQANGSLGDTFTVRYTALTTLSGGDPILNCNGTSYVGAPLTTHVYTNAFSLAVTPASSIPPNFPFALNNTWSLMCSVDGAAPVELITGLSKMEVLYGVKHSAVSGNSVDTYLPVAQMVAADWSNIFAIKVKLTFQNPLFIAGQLVPPATIPFERVIGVMNQNGVKL